MRAKPCVNLSKIPEDTEGSDLGQVKFRGTSLNLTLTSLLKDFSQPRPLIRSQQNINLFFPIFCVLLEEKPFLFLSGKKKGNCRISNVDDENSCSWIVPATGSQGTWKKGWAMCCFHQMVLYWQLLWRKSSLKEAFLRLRTINKGSIYSWH